jgi:hypothetical protein
VLFFAGEGARCANIKEMRWPEGLRAPVRRAACYSESLESMAPRHPGIRACFKRNVAAVAVKLAAPLTHWFEPRNYLHRLICCCMFATFMSFWDFASMMRAHAIGSKAAHAVYAVRAADGAGQFVFIN